MAAEKKDKKNEKNSAKTKAEALEEKTTKGAYCRYVNMPVVVTLVIIALLLAILAIYFVSAGDQGDTPTITDNDSVIETPDGTQKLVIYEFSDFACPYCSAAAGFNKGLINQFKAQDSTWEPVIPKIMEVYGDNVDLEFKHFLVHPSAEKAAEASECARDQDMFWEMHDIMFKNQGKLDVDSLKGYAADIGLNTTKFDACLDSGDKERIVSTDTALGKQLGVTGTPTFFIGGSQGIMIKGAQSFSKFNATIAGALADISGQAHQEGPENATEPFPEPTPEPAPVAGASVATFNSLLLDDGICTEDGKPIIRMYGTVSCPHCKWVGPAFDEVAKEYVDSGKIVAYHWQVNSGDDTLTDAVEKKVSDSEMDIYHQFNSEGSVPTFVFGCKYYRIGTRYESTKDLEAEKQDFREVIDALLTEVGE